MASSADFFCKKSYERAEDVQVDGNLLYQPAAEVKVDAKRWPLLGRFASALAECGDEKCSCCEQLSTSGLGKQLDSPEEAETELSMSRGSGAGTCSARYRMHQ